MQPPHWDDRPPSVDRLPIQVVKLPPGEAKHFRLLGTWRGIWLHWVRGRCRGQGHSTPCTAPKCRRCPAPTYWQAYAPALLWQQKTSQGQQWVPCICPLTSEHAAELVQLQSTQGLELIGLVITLQKRKRKEEAGRAPIHMQVITEPLKDQLPPAFDVTPYLLRMWRFEDAQDEAKEAQAEGLPASIAEGLDVPPAMMPIIPTFLSPEQPTEFIPSTARPAPTNGAGAEHVATPEEIREFIRKAKAGVNGKDGTNGHAAQTGINGTAADEATKPKRKRPRR